MDYGAIRARLEVREEKLRLELEEIQVSLQGVRALENRSNAAKKTAKPELARAAKKID